jgi:hypothetical protein
MLRVLNKTIDTSFLFVSHLVRRNHRYNGVDSGNSVRQASNILLVVRPNGSTVNLPFTLVSPFNGLLGNYRKERVLAFR